MRQTGVEQYRKKYNIDHGITPEGIRKAIGETMQREQDKEPKNKLDLRKIPKDEYKHVIKDLTGQMELASANLEFEKAAELRDLISELKAKL